MLDIKAAFRSLRRSPAFTVGAVLTLAVALGLVATTVGLLAGALSGDAVGPGRVVLYLTESEDGRSVPHALAAPGRRDSPRRRAKLRAIATYTSFDSTPMRIGALRRLRRRARLAHYLDVAASRRRLGGHPRGE